MHGLHRVVNDIPDAGDEAPRSGAPLDACIAAIRADDTHAFEVVYRALADDLMEFGASMLGDRAAARDIVADIFIALWERRTEWDPPYGVRAYLFAAVRRRALNALRDTRRRDHIHDALLADGGIPGVAALPMPIDQSLDIADQIEAVFRIIAQFPAARRMVMTLHWRNELSVLEIAEVMGITQNAVYHHLKRGLRTLKELLPEQVG